MRNTAALGMCEHDSDDISLTDHVAAKIRAFIVQGVYVPGAHLSEAALSNDFEVSRNTLREAFRSLTKEGLLRHECNRGVFVVVPDLATIVDVYTVRRITECSAILQATPYHIGIKAMREALEAAEKNCEKGDWIGVGTADIAFHTAIVSLAGSSRLSDYFARIMVELRLIFGLIDDPRYLHGPFIPMNRQLLDLLEDNEMVRASKLLEQYLQQAERMLLLAYAQRDS